tara:strand:- start:205671 stop:206258 length:588 start_codon:yes stop_codon:yes gene_type:complete
MNGIMLIVVLFALFVFALIGITLIAFTIGTPFDDLLGVAKGKKPKDELAHVFQRREPFLSAAELSFYHVLRDVLKHPTEPTGEDQALVMCKVRVADLVGTKKGLTASARQSAFNRIKAKHVDFVLVRPADMSVMCVIELDDSTHRQKKVQERDQLMDSIYGAAGLPIVHVTCRRGYVKEEVAGLIRGAMWVRNPA